MVAAWSVVKRRELSKVRERHGNRTAIGKCGVLDGDWARRLVPGRVGFRSRGCLSLPRVRLAEAEKGVVTGGGSGIRT